MTRARQPTLALLAAASVAGSVWLALRSWSPEQSLPTQEPAPSPHVDSGVSRAALDLAPEPAALALAPQPEQAAAPTPDEAPPGELGLQQLVRDDSCPALCEEGARRAWRLPFGSSAARDTLLNWDRRELVATQREELTQRLARWTEDLARIDARRRERVAALVEARLAATAGQAEPSAAIAAAASEPAGADGARVGASVRTPAGETHARAFELDADADPELLELARLRGEIWCAAVRELRRWFDAQPR